MHLTVVLYPRNTHYSQVRIFYDIIQLSTVNKGKCMATTEEVYNQEREIPATVTSISLNVSDLEGIVEKLEKALEPVMANVDTVHGDVAEVPSKTSLGGSLSSANSRLLRAKFRLMEILGNLEV